MSDPSHPSEVHSALDDSPLHEAVSAHTAARINRYLYLAVTLIILGGVGAFVWLSREEPAPEVEQERLEREAVRGAADTRVEVIQYGAYGCVTCRAEYQGRQIEQLLMTYEGQVRLVFRNWPRLEDNDPLTAEAAQCALDQGDDAFWTLHGALFSLSHREYLALDSVDEVVGLAAGAGLDTDTLRGCLETNWHRRTVEFWEENADARNIRGTPTFFVNGQRASSVAGIEAIIRQELGLES
ncbi:MAG: thioredoxin domain-containing protein [Anaerolineae bacterium]|nr:thioredoxin domain-containing protein [Anaerolineae bacterium]